MLLSGYNYDLTRVSEFVEFDIMQVFGTHDLWGYGLLDGMTKGESIWKRETLKTGAQIKLEEAERLLSEAQEKLKEAEIIEVFALAYMRGMNIDNSILIFEEAQNSTPNQMKLLLTRIGFSSKFFISGDLGQTDRYKDKKQSGLYDAITRFNFISGIGTFGFNDKDVVRNPLIKKIEAKFDEVLNRKS